MRRLIVVALAAALRLMAADSWIGSWKLIAANSSQNPPRTFNVTREGNQVHFKNSPNRMEFTVRYDGVPYPVANVPIFDHVTSLKKKSDTVELAYLKSGSVIETDRFDFSADGNEMIETNGFVQPSRPDVQWVWERTGGLREPSDTWVGEWTRNGGRSRLRQGLDVSIDRDESGSVRFAGEVQYTAKPDGMDYPVGNFPGFSVTLRYPDAHTVLVSFKFMDKVVGQESWELSDEGRRLSVASDKGYVDGTRLHEELAFERR